MSSVELESVDRVEITILVDNVTDPLLVDQQAVARMNWPKALLGGLPTAVAGVSPDSGVPDALIAEPGFSALVRIEKAGRKRTLLFDTGVSPNGMIENMRRLGIDPADVEVIVLSHGHWDHVTGIEGLVRVLGRTRLPVMIHPEFWSRRRISFPGIEPAELPSTSRAALQEMGFAIVEERQPSFLLDGAVLITGGRSHDGIRDGVPRTSGAPRWELAARPPDPRRSGTRGQAQGPWTGDSERLRPRRHRQHRAVRAPPDRTRCGRGDRRWLSPQRPDVRTNHRAHHRSARRALARASDTCSLHRVESKP